MKSKFLRVAALITATVFMLSLASCGKQAKKQLPTPTDRFFVNDFANVMTDADKDTVYTKGAALNNATTAQAVVVTVESLDGKEPDDYALELGREWGVGDKDKNNGVVVLLSEGDREIYIAVGYGLEGALPDSKTGRIIDTYGMSYFQNDEFSAGLVSVYNAVVNEIYIEYGMQPTENYTPIDLLPEQQDSAEASEVAVSWLILMILIMVYTIVFAKRGLFIFGPPRFFGGGFGSGGFGSGGSGFGGFKGGGGSFGGGGAGRKF